MRATTHVSTARRIAALSVGLLVLAACGDETATELPPVATDSVETTAPSATEPPAISALPAALDTWVRMPAMGQSIAAAYATFVNDTDNDVALLGVSSTFASAELHETTADADGVMRMRPRPEGFVVPANGELVLAPGGAHVMLLDVDVLALAAAGGVELTFDFGPSGALPVVAEVRGELPPMPGASGDMDPSDMDHEAMEPGDLWAHAMHDLDDELHVGVIEPDRQRAVVADFRAVLLATELPDGFDLDGLLAVLDSLDEALAAGDAPTAAGLAFQVHDLAHALQPH